MPVTVRVGRVRGRTPESVAERLEADLAIASRAHHPNVVRMLGAGVEDGWYYVVSEPVHGLMLSVVLERARTQGPWPTPELAGYITHQLSRALVYVHEIPGPEGHPLGALHRDLTPDGVIVDRNGTVRLAELVSSLDSQDLLETAGPHRSGQVAYASPESLSQTRHDARSDVFGLGAIFWELLTGQSPFLRDSDLETVEAVRSAQIPPMPPGVPGELASIAQRCLQRRPEDRFDSPWGVSQALSVVLEGRPEAGPRSMSQLMRALEGSDIKKRPRTAMLSEASQGILPSQPPPAASPDQAAPKAQAEADTAQTAESQDPFFDPVRDSGGLDHPRFEMLGRLGSGAMGEVYKVRDKELDEIVALKRIPSETADSKQGLERLKREVRIARRIASPHVCRIFDIVDLGQGERGLTMGVIEGTTLSELMQQPMRTDYERFARWGADIADGLAAAHGLNIVHRDLKPENVMIQSADDRAVLLDFGIARPQDDAPTDPKLTQAGIIMGTPLYMSPEQLANGPLDGRSDLYSLGLMLAELVTGEVPLQGASYSEILDRRVRQTIVYRLGNVDPGVPQALGELVDDLLAQAPAARPGTATDVKARLRSYTMGHAIGRDVPHAGEGGLQPTPSPHLERTPSFEAIRVPTIEPLVSSQPPDAGAPAFSTEPFAEPAGQAPAPDRMRYAVPAGLLLVIVVLLGFWVMRSPKVAPKSGGRLATERLAADAAAQASDAGPPDAGPVRTQAPPKVDSEPLKRQPPPPKAPPRRVRTLPPAEEM